MIIEATKTAPPRKDSEAWHMCMIEPGELSNLHEDTPFLHKYCQTCIIDRIKSPNSPMRHRAHLAENSSGSNLKARVVEAVKCSPGMAKKAMSSDMENSFPAVGKSATASSLLR